MKLKAYLAAAAALVLVPGSHCVLPYYSAPAPAYQYATYAKPVIQAPVYAHQVETIDPNPSYHFKYGVNDPSTGDYKSQEESKKDGVVHGSYTLAEPDGTIRTVTYTADEIHGFNAVVDKHSAKAVAPLKYVAPAPAYVAPAPAYVAHAPAYVAHAPAYVAAAPAAHVAPVHVPYAASYAYKPAYAPYASYSYHR